MRLLVFDIDGAPISVSRIGRMAPGCALVGVFGAVGSLKTYEFVGKTDWRIVHDLTADWRSV